jgi:hypothetical protein
VKVQSFPKILDPNKSGEVSGVLYKSGYGVTMGFICSQKIHTGYWWEGSLLIDIEIDGRMN